MEDPKLVNFFKKAFAEARKRGYSERVIRESAHEASPKAKWHERAYMSMVEGASVSFGITVIMLVIIFSSMIQAPLPITFLLLLPGGLLYYFAISAFKHHAGAKFFMTLFVSAILSLAAIIIRNLYVLLTTKIRVAYEGLGEQVALAKQFGLDTGQAGELVALFEKEQVAGLLVEPLALTSLVAAIFLAYNIAPIIGYIREHIKVEKS